MGNYYIFPGYYARNKEAKQKEQMVDAQCNFLMDEKVLPFDLKTYLEIASKLQQFTKCNYGYVFRYGASCNPDVYVMGTDSMSTTLEEIERNQKWKNDKDRWIKDSEGEKLKNEKGQLIHNTEAEAMLIRDIYRLNFFSDVHMNYIVDGIPFRKWIEKSKIGVFDELNREYLIKCVKNFLPSKI